MYVKSEATKAEQRPEGCEYKSQDCQKATVASGKAVNPQQLSSAHGGL